MTESDAYKRAAQAIRELYGSTLQVHIIQRVADSVASAILEAYRKGKEADDER